MMTRMEISNSGPTQRDAIRNQHRVESTDQVHQKARGGVRSQQAQDGAAISAQARLLQRLRASIEDTPDVREERVEALRAAVQEGRYPLSDAEIARAILASRAK